MSNRIHAKGDYRQEEGNAGEAGILPGMLVMLNTAGNIVSHDEEGGWAECAFAVEDALRGRTISDAYIINNILTYLLPVKGAEVYALLRDGQDISIGEKLISNGDGTLVSYDDSSSAVVLPIPLVVAMQALDLSGSAANVNTLIRVRIL